MHLYQCYALAQNHLSSVGHSSLNDLVDWLGVSRQEDPWHFAVVQNYIIEKFPVSGYDNTLESYKSLIKPKISWIPVRHALEINACIPSGTNFSVDLDLFTILSENEHFVSESVIVFPDNVYIASF